MCVARVCMGYHHCIFFIYVYTVVDIVVVAAVVVIVVVSVISAVIAPTVVVVAVVGITADIFHRHEHTIAHRPIHECIQKTDNKEQVQCKARQGNVKNKTRRQAHRYAHKFSHTNRATQ